MSKSSPSTTDLDRRTFLRGAGAAAGAAAVIATGVTPEEARAEPTPTSDQAGYKETAHIRQVYDLARF